MTVRHLHSDKSTAGFTLLEALIATALMAMILAALATVTAQWLPNWNRGVSRIQGNERIALSLERVSADLAAAELIPANNQTPLPLFDGGPRQAMFVRTAVGANAGPGLEIVRLAEVSSAQGPMLVRSRTPFLPNLNPQALQFGDPVVLLRMPYRLSFSYSGKDRKWRDDWRRNLQLPTAVKLTLHDSGRPQISFSTAILLHAELSVECLLAKSLAECLTKHVRPPDGRDKSPT
jgi:general secretion pathway protein J